MFRNDARQLILTIFWVAFRMDTSSAEGTNDFFKELTAKCVVNDNKECINWLTLKLLVHFTSDERQL